MKISKIAMVCIIMLAIFTLGAVSAAEDANLTAEQGELETIDEAPLAEEEYITVEIDSQDDIKFGEYHGIKINVEENVTGQVIYYLNDNEADAYAHYIAHDEPVDDGFDVNEFGPQTLHVKYFDGNRPDKHLEFPFTVNDYYMNVYPMDSADELKYGHNNWFIISIPYIAQGTIVTLVNGHEYTYKYDNDFGWGDSEFTIKKEDLVYGENTIKSTFTPYDKASEFKTKTIEKSYNFTSRIEAPDEIPYNSEGNISLTLPSDAEGTLTLNIGKDTYTKEIENGVATIAIPKLNVGDYEIYAKFEGNYEIEELYRFLRITPNIIAPQYLWDKGEQKITVEVSDDITGTIKASVDGEEVASAEIKNGTAVLNLNLPIGYQSILLDYEGDSYLPASYIYLEVISEDPNWEMHVSDEDTMKTYAFLAIENYPEYLSYETGAFELTIDGKKVECEALHGSIYFNATDLAVGQHEYTLTFNGDGYFLPTSTSGKVNISDIIVRAPEKYVYRLENEETDWIYVYMPNDTVGTLTIKSNGKQIYSEKTTPDENYAIDRLALGELELKFNEINKIEVVFKSPKYGTVTKTVDIYATYALLTLPEARYGGSRLFIRAPENLDVSKLSVKIDGVDHEVFKGEEYEAGPWYVITGKDLSIGFHNATLTYTGDKTYTANTNTSQFKVYASIEILDNIVSLILPNDAKGNLTVIVNDEVYSNVRANGNVEVDLNELPWGKYDINTQYTGDDYQVFEDDREISVNPKFDFPQKMIVGSDESASINLPGIEGRFEIFGDDLEPVEENLVNGSASISLAGLPVGTHGLYIAFTHTYYDDEGYENEQYYSEYVKIEVINPITAKDASVLYSASGTYTAQIKDVNGKAITSGKVTFYIMDGKKQIIKKAVNIKNGVAKLTYKITTAPKVYTIKTVYNKASVSKKLTVKSIVALKAVTVKKSAKKLTLQATLKKVNGKYLKGKKITFKFNGKKYAAKTNKKGVAKVTVKKAILNKLKVGKKITYTATYAKDTAKKTVKVKK